MGSCGAPGGESATRSAPWGEPLMTVVVLYGEPLERARSRGVAGRSGGTDRIRNPSLRALKLASGCKKGRAGASVPHGNRPWPSVCSDGFRQRQARVSMASLIGVGGAAVAVLGAVWMIAYRMGFREGRESIPLQLIKALAQHRVVCDGNRPDLVVRELVDGLKLAEREGRRLVSQVRSERDVAVPELRTAS